jgi:DNA processing protein
VGRSDATLRRPSDIAREAGAGGGRFPRERGHPEWPEGFATGPEDRAALLVLLSLASLTPRRLLELASVEATASACLAAVRAGRAGSEGDRRFAGSVDPAEVRRAVEATGTRLVAVHDAEYPPALLDLFDPPAGLFVAGFALRSEEPRVAIVGARSCSPSGREAASVLAGALVSAGACVVSGGARGIDEAAHRGAVSAGGRSIAVLGCGLDVPYPRSNAKLFQELRATGVLVTEYPPGTRAEPFRFPARNRIVAALATAVVVVEGAEGSGSMITAEHAMEIGREVFGVPGPISSPLSFVPHTLIRDGATLVRGAAELLQDLALAPSAPSGSGPGSPASLTPEEAAVWDALVSASTPDTIARAVDRPVSRVIGALVALEIRGVVRQVGGRYQRRLSR